MVNLLMIFVKIYPGSPPCAPGQSRLIHVGTRIVREIDIMVISICGSKPLSSKT